MSARFPPDSSEEWIRRAHSSLSIAHCCRPGICLEDLCFQAQQAAEKAIKALFIVRALPLPYIHDISDLLHRLERSGLPIPDAIKSASRLTPFAVHTRYPSFEVPVGETEYAEALTLAESVVNWAENILNDKRS